MAQDKLIDGKYEYFAFISYKEEDAEWAKWLQRKLEHYKLPTTIRKEKPELPEHISPIYEYKSEAGGGRLKEVIWKGLTSSKYLIVICSPRAGGNKSKWLNNGIRHFIDSGQEENIIPFIVEGKPKTENPDEECFPSALLELKDDRELRGININEMGRDAAAVKVVSRMFDVKFDTLWQRYEREQRKQRRKKVGTVVGGISILTIASIIFSVIVSDKNSELEKANNEILQERDRADSLKNVAFKTNDSLQVAFANIKLQKDSILKQNQIISKQKNDLNQTNKELQLSNVKLAQERDNVLKANWKMMVNQSKSAAGKANELIENGDPLMAERIMMNYLPDSASNIRLPYVPEVEQVFRKSLAIINSAEWHQDTYLEHKLKINTAIFNSDGSKILSSSNDNTACLWDIETGDTITFLHDRLVNCAAISTDGKFVATGCRDKVARIWNAETGQLVDSWEPGGNVWEIMFTNDDKYVLTRSSQEALSFYSVNSHKLLGRFPYRQRLSHYIFDEERESFVYGFMDSLVTLVNIPLLLNKFESIEKIATNDDLEGFRELLCQMQPNGITPILYPHSYNVQDIKYNSQRGTVCILCSDSVAVYGNMITGAIIDTIPNVLDFSFSPDGTTLALSKNDGKLLLIRSHGETYDYDESSIETHAVFHQINYSENSSYLIGSSSDNVTYLWDVSDKYAEVAKLQHKSPINFSYVNNTASNILTVTNDNHVNLWGHSVGYNKTSLALADSYADAVIFNNAETVFYVASYSGHISCYDVITGKRIWVTTTYSENYNNLRNGCIDLSADGSKLAIGNESGEIIIVNATSGEMLNRYRIHKEVINSIFFIDNNKVITSSHDGTVIISDIVDGKSVRTCNHDNRVIFANIIKGRQQILSATANGLYLWEIGTNESSFFPLNNDEIESVAYNILTNKVAIGTSNNSICIKPIDDISKSGLVFQHGQSPKGELFLFDAYLKVEHDTALIKKMQGSMEGYHIGSSLYDILSHKGRVDALQFSIDGKYLVSKCKSSIKVWDTTTGICVNDDIKIGIGFRCFTMSPNKTYIITSSMDVRNVIPNEKNSLIDYLFLWKFNSLNKSLWKEKERLPNWELTPEEKRKYYLE